MSIRNSAPPPPPPPPPVASGSRRSRRLHQPNAIHELYFHDVFNLLRVYPEGLSIAVVTTSIPRWKYPGGVPQVKKLAEIEPKTFRLQGEILFVKVTSPRVNSIATTPSATNNVAAASTAGTPQRSRTVPRLLPRDDFFQDVYTLLYAQAPHGISCDKLSLLVKRKDYQNPPRFVKLPIEEPQSFLFDPRTNMLYAEWSSLRAKKNIGEQYSFRTGLLPTPIPATPQRVSSAPVSAASNQASPSYPTLAARANAVPAAPIAQSTSSPFPQTPSFPIRDNLPAGKVRRDAAADSFYAFVKEYYNAKSAKDKETILYNDLRPLHQAWMNQSQQRCGLYYIVQNLQSTKRLRFTRTKTIKFAFFDQTRINAKELERNKGGISISDIVFPASSLPNVSVSTIVTITNHGDEVCALQSCDFLQVGNVFTTSIQCPLLIAAQSSVDYEVRGQSANIGIHASSLLFTFVNFMIVRSFRLNISEDPDLQNSMRQEEESRPPRRKQARRRVNAKQIIAGDRPTGSSTKWLHNLKSEYIIPSSIYSSESDGEIPLQLEAMASQLHQQGAVSSEHINTLQCYGKMHDCMLYVEECQMQRDIAQYDLQNVPLRQVINSSKFFLLEVPGLAEKRPSVLIGDHVDVYPSSAATEVEDSKDVVKYRGYVWEVFQSEVKLAFHYSFMNQHVSGKQYHVEFSFRRTPLQIMHDSLFRYFEKISDQKVTTAADLALYRQIIYPTKAIMMPAKSDDLQTTTAAPSITTIRLVNRNLNLMQKQAVMSILKPFPTTRPFLLFGPPGTGKTVTLVEAIIQLYNQLKSTSTSLRSSVTSFFVGNKHKQVIVVSAPSNYAADLLLERLAKSIPKSDIFRYMSYSRSINDVPLNILEYCKLDGDNHFILPSKEELLGYPIIVCTCSMASRLYHYGIDASNIAAMIMDESGHCWEIEAMTPMLNLIDLKKAQKFILAGDPKQLGPISRSPFANITGFHQSLLERYMEYNSVFFKDLALFPQTNGYNPDFIVKLTTSYRCHPEIIKLPNEMFYDGDLHTEADPVITTSLLRWEGLPTKTFPMLFHGCIGENMQEAKSPSWFNVAEVELVIKYVTSLQEYSRQGGFTMNDIGIITPYSRQVYKIREALKKKKLDGCTVGSCEQFQGQERRIIIISTVRSSIEYIQSDTMFNIGFLNNPKRFNVAITRAKALVIVIGNPHVLATDPHWGQILWHCVDHNSYKGVLPLPTRPHPGMPEEGEAEVVVAMLEQLHIQSNVNIVEEVDATHNEQTWQHEE